MISNEHITVVSSPSFPCCQHKTQKIPNINCLSRNSATIAIVSMASHPLMCDSDFKATLSFYWPTSDLQGHTKNLPKHSTVTHHSVAVDTYSLETDVEQAAMDMQAHHWCTGTTNLQLVSLGHGRIRRVTFLCILC